MTIPTAPMILLWLFIMQVGGIIGYVYAHRRMRNQQRESAIRSSDLESMITRAVEEAVAPLRSRKSQLDDEAASITSRSDIHP